MLIFNYYPTNVNQINYPMQTKYAQPSLHCATPLHYSIGDGKQRKPLFLWDWEEDLQTTFLQAWKDYILFAQKKNKFPVNNRREAISCWPGSPELQIYRQVSSFCWLCKEVEVIFLEIFRTCPRLRGFWDVCLMQTSLWYTYYLPIHLMNSTISCTVNLCCGKKGTTCQRAMVH